MESAPLPPNEPERLQSLYSLGVLDTGLDPVLQSIVDTASQIAETPISLISLVDSDRQWFKARRGLDATETPREIAFCSHAILQVGVFEVQNAAEHPKFRDNPLVIGYPGIRSYAGIPLRTSDGHNIGTLCVIDRKERAHSNDVRRMLQNLAMTAVRFIEMNRELERVNALPDLKISHFAHEFKTPLNHIVGFSSLGRRQIQTGAPIESLSEVLEIIQDSGEHLNAVVERAILFEQSGDAGSLDFETLKPAKFIEHIGTTFSQALKEKSQQIRISVADKYAEVFVDPTGLRQILTNLISNASKYSPEGTEISLNVSTSEDKCQCVMEVIDQGPGMPAEVLRNLGQSFNRGPQARKKNIEGSGLGLQISMRFADAIGGSLIFENLDGGGTKASFSIALAGRSSKLVASGAA